MITWLEAHWSSRTGRVKKAASRGGQKCDVLSHQTDAPLHVNERLRVTWPDVPGLQIHIQTKVICRNENESELKHTPAGVRDTEWRSAAHETTIFPNNTIIIIIITIRRSRGRLVHLAQILHCTHLDFY